MSRRLKVIVLWVMGACIMPISSFSQNHADSLKAILPFAGSDTEKINILNRIADFYNKVDSNQLQLQYLKRALILANQKNLPIRQAEMEKQVGTLFLQGGLYDSALAYLKPAEDYYTKTGPEKRLISVYYGIGLTYAGALQYSQAENYYNKLLALADKYKDSLHIYDAYNSMGTMYFNEGDFKLALDYFNKGLVTCQQYKLYMNAIALDVQIGTIYVKQSTYPPALQAFQDALRLNTEHMKQDKIAGVIYVDIGNLYNAKNDTSQSLNYYRIALAIFQKQKITYYTGAVLMDIGNAYMESGDYKNAERYELQSLDFIKKNGTERDLALSYTNVGEFYNKTKQYAKAEQYYNMALDMQKDEDNREGEVYSLSGLSQLYFKTGQYAKAQESGMQAISIAQTVGLLSMVRDISQSLSTIFQKTGQTDKSFYYYKLFVDTRDSIDNKEASRKLIRTELDYEFAQKQQAQKLEDEKKEAINTERANHERKLRNLYLAGFIVVLILSVLVLRNLFRVRKANKIITEQKTEVEQQKTLVDQKNRDITDSINYAKRIQQAMLPTIELWDQCFKESFIYYQPKDIVSGDFYWTAPPPPEGGIKASKIPPSEGLREAGSFIIAVADCTGHGVPGAFMSMLGISSLNKIVGEQGIKQADKILNALRDEIIKSLNPEGKKEEVKDGMDMTLCCLNMEKGELEYAAANNPLWVMRKNAAGYELLEGEADKMPVGKYVEDKLFTSHKIEIKKGDRIYLFTDGYADQFGGEKGKKFKYKRLQQLIIDNAQLTMERQKQVLEREFENWRGKLEQVDDVLVIGIEV